jgi:two-component system OmpR family response regulator
MLETGSQSMTDTPASKVVGEVRYDRLHELRAQVTAPTSASPAPSCPGRFGDESFHALVVEDDADLLELIAAHMRRLGCSVSLARSGTEGLFAALDRTPDIAIVDIELPDMDGRSLIGTLRRNRSTAQCRIVVTSILDPHDFTATGDAVLAKPFDRSDVDRVVGALLNDLR